MKAKGVVISTPTSGSLGTYTINSQTATLSALPSSSSGVEYPLVDFDMLTASVDPSAHNTLQITAGGSGAFYLDYLLLDADKAFISESVPNICNGSVRSSDGQGGRGGKHTGAIAGGVLGAVVALIVIGGVAWILVRRNRRKIARAQTGLSERGDTGTALHTPTMTTHHDSPVFTRGITSHIQGPLIFGAC